MSLRLLGNKCVSSWWDVRERWGVQGVRVRLAQVISWLGTGRKALMCFDPLQNAQKCSGRSGGKL